MLIQLLFGLATAGSKHPTGKLVVVLFEILRAKTVVFWWGAANASIPASFFNVAVFGPIVIGALGGCGGALFLKGRQFLASPVNWLIKSGLMASTLLTVTTTDLLAPVHTAFGWEPGMLNLDRQVCHFVIVVYFIQTRLVATFRKKEKQS